MHQETQQSPPHSLMPSPPCLKRRIIAFLLTLLHLSYFRGSEKVYQMSEEGSSSSSIATILFIIERSPIQDIYIYIYI